MMANLFGDFVKGRDYSNLPLIVQQGVKLHREIDDFIDHHPDVTQLRIHLYDKLPKIAGIAIDLYMDHILAKNWNIFSTTNLEEFIESFFNHALKEENHIVVTENSSYAYPKEFIELLFLMNERNWILRYKEIEGLEMASSGLSKRISFENNLHEAPQVFIEERELIHTVFQKFMRDAQIRFE